MCIVTGKESSNKVHVTLEGTGLTDWVWQHKVHVTLQGTGLTDWLGLAT
jgi:hypothetical protein